MELSVKLNEGVASWETVIFLYTSALKEVIYETHLFPLSISSLPAVSHSAQIHT